MPCGLRARSGALVSGRLVDSFRSRHHAICATQRSGCPHARPRFRRHPGRHRWRQAQCRADPLQWHRCRTHRGAGHRRVGTVRRRTGGWRASNDRPPRAHAFACCRCRSGARCNDTYARRHPATALGRAIEYFMAFFGRQNGVRKQLGASPGTSWSSSPQHRRRRIHRRPCRGDCRPAGLPGRGRARLYCGNHNTNTPARCWRRCRGWLRRRDPLGPAAHGFAVGSWTASDLGVASFSVFSEPEAP